MRIIDRNNILDAKKCIDAFFKDLENRDQILAFLSSKIEFANSLNCDNWNLNLDLNGKFLRFNVGQEYCIQLTSSEYLILCLRHLLPSELSESYDIEFRGYDKKLGVVQSNNIAIIPDDLVKVSNSIGCVIKKNFDKWLPLLEESNIRFIDYAIKNTKIMPQMRGAHSVGSIDYLSLLVKKELPNPSFVFNAIQENENIVLRKIKNIPESELKKLASLQTDAPHKAYTKATIFIRSPYVVELAKRLAKGICQDCDQPAPFVSKITNEPYLEVHHICPLSEGGKDIIENVIALCPNCHRKRHYG